MRALNAHTPLKQTPPPHKGVPPLIKGGVYKEKLRGGVERVYRLQSVSDHLYVRITHSMKNSKSSMWRKCMCAFGKGSEWYRSGNGIGSDKV